jgi:hypothetical protein
LDFDLVERAEMVTLLCPVAVCKTAAVVAEHGVGVAEGLLPADA